MQITLDNLISVKRGKRKGILFIKLFTTYFISYKNNIIIITISTVYILMIV